MSSANIYRQAISLGPDPFDLSGSELSNKYLNHLTEDPSSLRDSGGRYPGTWTIPVCNAGDWGDRWNQDYTKSHDRHSSPPCFCAMLFNRRYGSGKLTKPEQDGLETGSWAIAAGLQNFGTFQLRCWSDLKGNFPWLLGINSVNLSFAVEH